MHSFEAQEPGELSLTLGDIVAVRQVSDPYIHTFVHSYVTLVVALCSLTLGLICFIFRLQLLARGWVHCIEVW